MVRSGIAIAAGLCLLALPLSGAVHLRHRSLAEGSAALAALPSGPTSVIVASRGRVTGEWKRALEARGARIVSYLPEDAFLVRIDGRAAAALEVLPGTAFAAPLLPGDKLAPELAAALAGRAGVPLPLHILIAPDVPASLAARELQALGLDVSGSADGGPFNDVGAFLPPGRLDLAERAAGLDAVLWIEPRARRVLLNDASIWVCQSGLDGGQATPVFQNGIYGAGETVAVLDTGLDWDMCYFDDPAGPPPLNPPGGLAVDPTRRKVVAYDFIYSGDSTTDPADCDNHGHGTHVMGSVAGDDLRTPTGHDGGDGMAPLAKLIAQDGGYTGTDACSDLAGLGCPVVDLTPFYDQAFRQGARYHSNSWGDREDFMPQNTYTAACVDTDDFMWTHPDFLILYAAGNSGPNADTVGSPSTAKDTLSVAATNHDAGAESLANFSSRGYAADGRRKPTLAAPGVNVSSARNDGDTRTGNCGAVAFSGTSMACPTAAGLSTLVAEYFTAGYYPGRVRNPADGFRPSAALIKASLVSSGRAMAGEASFPSRGQGFGRITLADVLAFPGSPRDLWVTDDRAGFATGATAARSFSVEVRGSSVPLKAALVWTDPPSNPIAAKNLVNDLDLAVSGPSGTFLGNVFGGGFSTPGGSADRINVEEVVWIQDPAPGTYTIEVRPFSVPQGPQPFALVVTGDLPTPLDLGYETHAVAGEENGNGWPDVGESVRLAITLRNRSDAAGSGITGTLSSLSPDLTVLDPSASWPDLAAGEAKPSLADHFLIRVEPAAACGALLPLQLAVQSGSATFDVRFDLAVGGMQSVLSDRFDQAAADSPPPGWSVSSSRPASGIAVADATVEPVAGSPGPVSPPNALFVGTSGNDSSFTRIEARRNLDLGPWAGRPARLSFAWWVYDAEALDAMSVELSDSGPVFFDWTLLRTPASFDSARDAGGQWGRFSIDLATLAGFTAGPDVWIRLNTVVTASEANGDGFYLDDLDLSAVSCDPAGCAAVTADVSATAISTGCPNRPVTLDGSRSRSAAPCSTLVHEWYAGSTLVATGAVATVYPLEPTRYRLEVHCASPPSCTSSYAIDVPVDPASRSVVAYNSLRAVKGAGGADLSWLGAGGGFNVAASVDRTEIPILWTRSALNPSPLAAPAFTDSTPAGPGTVVHYQAYGTNSCNGRSMP